MQKKKKYLKFVFELLKKNLNTFTTVLYKTACNA